MVHVNKNGQIKDVLWEDIAIGDIVQLSDNEMIPCDMVVLSTSQEQNQCYVQTSNIDGETSLKTKFASPLTKHLKNLEELNQFLGCVQCENPNNKAQFARTTLQGVAGKWWSPSPDQFNPFRPFS